MTTTIYKSDTLINSIERETGSKFNAAQRSAIQKEIRTMFVAIHRKAVDQTIIAKNKRDFTYPNFED